MKNFFKILSDKIFGLKPFRARSTSFLLPLFLAFHIFQISIAPGHEWIHFAKSNSPSSAWESSGFDCDECLLSHTIVSPSVFRNSIRESWGQFELLVLIPSTALHLKKIITSIQVRAPPHSALI